MLSDQLRLEGTVPISRYFDGQFAEVTLERLAALAVTRVASIVGNRLVLAVTKMFGKQTAVPRREALELVTGQK